VEYFESSKSQKVMLPFGDANMWMQLTVLGRPSLKIPRAELTPKHGLID
jgi:hypothetical protein